MNGKRPNVEIPRNSQVNERAALGNEDGKQRDCHFGALNVCTGKIRVKRAKKLSCSTVRNSSPICLGEGK